jgi:hypothetical protein
VSERDLPNMDDVELPDIPDDEELDSAESAEGDAPAESEDESAGGRFGPLLAKLSPLLAVLAPLPAKVGALAAPLGKIAAPLANLAAPVGKAVAPAAAIAAPLVARVPRPILAGVGSFAGVLVVIVLLVSAIGGGRGAAEASNAAGKPSAIKSPAPIAEVPKPPTPAPTPSPTPSEPTPTPTPAGFTRQGTGWVAVGTVIPNPRQKLIPERMLFLDDERGSYRLVANASVLLRSGPLAPLWGIVLGFQDESNHLRLEFFSDSYDQDRPYGALFITKGGQSRSVGPTVKLLNGEHWRRDTHEIVVEVTPPDIVATINGEVIGQWKHQDPTLALVKKGVYVWGGSRIRFDSIRVEDPR